MHGRVLKGNVNWLDQTSANSIRDGLDKFFLGRSFCVVDTEDILLVGRWRLEYFFNHTSQIFHMNSRYEVLTLTNDRQFLRVLLPRTLKVVVENGLTKSVEDSGRDNVGLNALFFEV